MIDPTMWNRHNPRWLHSGVIDLRMWNRHKPRWILWWMLLLLVMTSTPSMSRAQEDDSLPPLGTAMEDEELPPVEPVMEAEEVRQTEGEALPSPEPDLEKEGGPEIEAGEGLPIVRAIEVEGGQRIEPDVIFLRIRTREGDRVKRKTIREDIRTIMETGYFRQVIVEALPVPGGVKIIYHIEERPMIREVRYEGVKELEEDDLIEVVTIQVNTFLNIGALKENVEKIRKLYANEGYFRANVEYETEPYGANLVNVSLQGPGKRGNQGSEGHVPGEPPVLRQATRKNSSDEEEVLLVFHHFLGRLQGGHAQG